MRTPLLVGVLVALMVPASAAADTLSYPAVGATQYWDVPAGVTQATFDLYGSQGGGVSGGKGAHVHANLTVTPLERLYVFVGGQGGLGSAGFNGGATGGSQAMYPGYGGGGATDIRRGGVALGDRLSVAAGGGGTGGGSGAGGGGASGQDADVGVCSGKAATTSRGGSAGLMGCGNKGSPGTLGAGGDGQSLFDDCREGGGGGGGLYGGGGGGGDCFGGYGGSGGGGGSTLIARSDLLVGPGALREDGVRSGEGLATITFTPGPAAAMPPASPAGGAALTAGDITKPLLTGLRFARSSFAAAPSGASTSAKRRRAAPVGTRVSFSLSEPSAVRFSVQRKTTGRKVGSSCAAPKRSNRKKRRCTRYVTVAGSFSIGGKAGVNSFTFRGRISKKSLRRGSYRLVGVATDTAGNRSAAVTRSFAIVR